MGFASSFSNIPSFFNMKIEETSFIKALYKKFSTTDKSDATKLFCIKVVLLVQMAIHQGYRHEPLFIFVLIID
ncbi:hypothetical protein E1A91_D08G060300v1 [Gossypium mustelinum]|uniref:Uncharacterized protein n=1 Tax=Gossypium mustelinum TaxID=34275 RepID=A0A5D2TS43_GOSMU|nr:hypothetical protein E1A91_D08G060300v1 [Gossypium mustelinum]